MLLFNSKKAIYIQEEKLKSLSLKGKASKSILAPLILTRDQYIETTIQLPKIPLFKVHKAIKHKLQELHPKKEQADFVFHIIKTEQNKQHILLFTFAQEIIDKHLNRNVFIIPESLLFYQISSNSYREIISPVHPYFIANHQNHFQSRLKRGLATNQKTFLHSASLPEELPQQDSITSQDWSRTLISQIRKMPARNLATLYCDYTFRSPEKRRKFFKQLAIATSTAAIVIIAYFVFIHLQLSNQNKQLRAEEKLRSKQIKEQIDLQDQRQKKLASLEAFQHELASITPATLALKVTNELFSQFPTAKFSTIRTNENILMIKISAESSSEILDWLNKHQDINTASINGDLRANKNGNQDFELNIQLGEKS